MGVIRVIFFGRFFDPLKIILEQRSENQKCSHINSIDNEVKELFDILYMNEDMGSQSRPCNFFCWIYFALQSKPFEIAQNVFYSKKNFWELAILC